MGLIGISGHIGSGKDTVGRIIQGLLIGEDKFVDGVEGFLEAYDDVDENVTPLPYTIKKFADKLKDCVCLITGCSRAELENPDFKEQKIVGYDGVWLVYTDKYQEDPYPPLWFESEIAAGEFLQKQNCVYYSSTIPATLTYRELLQQLGTNVGRLIHPNMWVNALMSEYKPEYIGSNYYDFAYPKKLIEAQYQFWKNNPDIRDGNQTPVFCKEEYPNWIITDMRFPNELKAVKDRRGITIRVNRLSVEQSAYERAKHESETALDNATFDYVVDNDGTIAELTEKVREILTKEKLLCK